MGRVQALGAEQPVVDGVTESIAGKGWHGEGWPFGRSSSSWVASAQRLADGGDRGLSPSKTRHDRPSSTAAGRFDAIQHSHDDNIVIDACPPPTDLRRSCPDQGICTSYRHRVMVPIDRFGADSFMKIVEPVDVAPPSCLTVLSRS